MTTGTAASPSLTRRDWVVAGCLFVLTLALRLTFLLRSPDAAWPHSMLYEGDAPVWARWAALLQAGQPFEDDLAFRTPGVAFPLAWLGLTKPPFTVAKVLWCVMSAATPALLWLLMSRWFSRTAGLVAASLVALGFGSFAVATSLNNETPYALLLTLIAAGTLAWIHRPGFGKAIALGVMHGAALLLRAEHLLLLWMLAAYMAWRWWRAAPRCAKAWRQIACVPPVAIATCLPWSIRSHAAAERFNTVAAPIAFESMKPPFTPEAVAVIESLPAFARASNAAYIGHLGLRGGWPAVKGSDVTAFFEREWGSVPEPIDTWCLVSFKGPLDFALSNHPQADGGFSRAALADSHDRDPPFHLARPSHLRLVNHGWRVGWSWIAADPRRWMDLEWEKLRRFADGLTLGIGPSDWPHAQRLVRRPIDVATPKRGDAPAWNASMLACLAAGAVVAARTRGGGVWLLVVAWRLAVILTFYGYARHAVSIAPATAALCGLAVTAAASVVASRWTFARIAVPWLGATALVAAALSTAWSSWNPPAFRPRAAMVGDRLNRVPEWGPDAFEAVDAVALEPSGTR